MSKKKYRNYEQRDRVVHLVEAMLQIGNENNCYLSQETLTLAFNRYCHLVDPDTVPGETDERYED